MRHIATQIQNVSVYFEDRVQQRANFNEDTADQIMMQEKMLKVHNTVLGHNLQTKSNFYI